MKTAIKTMIVAAAVAVAAFAGNSSLAAPASFAYQGVLLESNGQVPTNKTRMVEFRIYDGPTSKKVLWGRASTVLLDSNGLFNTELSDLMGSAISGVTGTGLAGILATNANTTLYIGLTVDNSSGEITPRQAILAVPYAMYAADAAMASGDFEVAGKLKGGNNGLAVSGNTTLYSATVTTNLAVNSGNVTVAAPGAFVGYGTIPVGGIIMWSGKATDIPDGWALCDGKHSYIYNGRTNTTPNLSGRFVVGYSGDGDYKEVGWTGGYEMVTLTTNQIPAHTHDREVQTVGYKEHYNDESEALTWLKKYNSNVGGNYGSDEKTNGVRRLGPSTIAGGGGAHENRPPYYVLCYIMRVK